MPSQSPLLSFLRPLALPRPSTVRHFLRFSTSTPCRASAEAKRPQLSPNPQRDNSREDPNLVASRSASPSYPPPSMKSKPRPLVKNAIASRRTRQPTKQRLYPTRQPSHHQPTTPKLIPEPVTPLPSEQCAPNLPYFITRTKSKELPVYQERKRGGNLMMTRVRKIDGDALRLRDELRAVLGVEDKHCVVNSVNGHVMLKGHYKQPIERFLRERMF